jgi:transcription elongation factor GreA
MNKQFKLTQEGAQELAEEKEQLLASRGEIAERIKLAREFGDLSENAEYSSARQEQERSEARLAEIEHILQNTELITAPQKKDEVELGNMVVLSGPNGDKTFTIVGSVEADPLEGKVSNESPIGQSLMGRKVGESVEIKTPSETIEYTIKSVK